jgi:hypothetical protein
MDKNHHFTGNEQAEYDSLSAKGRTCYDHLRWYGDSTHAKAFEKAMEKFGGKSPELLALEAAVAALPECHAISPENTQCNLWADHEDEHYDRSGLTWEGPEPDHFDTTIPGEYTDYPKGNGAFVTRCACGEEFWQILEGDAKAALTEHIKSEGGHL